MPHLVKKGSLTTCKTTDSVGVHGNSGNKSVKVVSRIFRTLLD